jgi:hypothetical protein
LKRANWQSAIFLAVAEGFEPSIAGLTIRCLTNLATPQKLNLAAATRVELVSSRLQDERSVIQLSYAAIWWTGRDSNPHKKFAGLLCCRLHHQPERIWWLWVESNHQPRAYETLALIPFELHGHILEARGGVEPRAFPPSSSRFGLEDRRRERGPKCPTCFSLSSTHPTLELTEMRARQICIVLPRS